MKIQKLLQYGLHWRLIVLILFKGIFSELRKIKNRFLKHFTRFLSCTFFPIYIPIAIQSRGCNVWWCSTTFHITSNHVVYILQCLNLNLYFIFYSFLKEPKLFIVKIAILESYKNAPRLRKQLEIILGGVFISSQWWLQISNTMFFFLVHQPIYIIRNWSEQVVYYLDIKGDNLSF